jgi:hypothetical protein
MIRAIRHEYRMIALGLGAAVVMAIAHLAMGGGIAPVFWFAAIVIAFLYGFTYVWVHVGLRNQQSTADYYPIEEARKFVSPHSRVVVIAKNGVARAHPDSHIMRPHVAGNDAGLDGENVVMTYCAIANLGIGYTPEIDGQALKLEVLAQHGNNLILRDNVTGEPIQHIYGHRERDGRDGRTMAPWPTFRMTFRGFEKAYPSGQVFLNKPSANPLLRVFDLVAEILFSYGIGRQHDETAPVMDNMTHFDERLPNKTYVWGIDIADDAVCYTDDFILENGGLINATVGGRPIVVYQDLKLESIGIWYNESGAPVTRMDFFGDSDRGPLKRCERLKSGLFWHVWAEFYPHTDINRTNGSKRPDLGG